MATKKQPKIKNLTTESTKSLKNEKTQSQINSKPPFQPLSFSTIWNNPPGFTIKSSYDYAFLRKVRCHPTVTLGLAIHGIPVRASKWNYVAKDNAPKEALELIEKQLENLRPYIVDQALHSITYGWQPFEIVWENKDNYICVKNLKPLLHDKTSVLVNEHGSFEGLSVDANKTELGTFKSMVFSHNAEYGFLYGKSQLENIVGSFLASEDITKRLAQFITKVAGSQILVWYPEGESIDSNNATVTNFEMAQALLKELSTGNGVAAPSTIHPSADMFVNSGMKPDNYRAWSIEYLNSETTDHATGLDTSLRYFDAQLLRGLLVPERTALESTGGGTKAESDVQGSWSINASNQTLEEIVRHLNWYLIPKILELNFGEKVKDSIQVIPEPVESAKLTLLRELVRMTFSPSNPELALQVMDMDKILEQLGIPTMGEQVVANVVDDMLIQKEMQQEMQQEQADQYNNDNGNKANGTPDNKPRANEKPNNDKKE
jgi:hypothetical protein